MTANELTAVAGLFLSLLFSYVPGINNWMAVQTPIQKRLVMLGLLALSAIVVFGISCTPLAATIGLTVACTTASAYQLLTAFGAAAIANQTTFAISPPRSAYIKLKKQSAAGRMDNVE